MISIQITCPFRYQYKKKDIFFMAGEYYHLDEVKDKEEVKKILSSSFEFKEYIYVNIETIPDELLKDSKSESTGTFHSRPVEEEEYASTLIEGTKSIYQLEDPGPDYQEAPTKDADENYWAKITEAQGRPTKKVEQPKEVKTDLDHSEKEKLEKQTRIEEEKHQGALNTPDIKPEDSKQVAETTAVAFKDEEREARRKELDELHYTKIQDVAEQYHIEYTKKDPTIEAILKAEFDVHNDIKELEGQYKTDEDLKK